jgi:hypothetical protein
MTGYIFKSESYSGLDVKIIKALSHDTQRLRA